LLAFSDLSDVTNPPVSPTAEYAMSMRELYTALRRYCHAITCDSIEACPRAHPDCRGMLGLDTAIAWEAAEAVEMCLVYYKENDFENFRTELERVTVLFDVVTRHQETHQQLYRLLMYSWERLERLERRLKRRRVTA